MLAKELEHKLGIPQNNIEKNKLSETSTTRHTLNVSFAA
jgi:hypothetical protein